MDTSWLRRAAVGLGILVAAVVSGGCNQAAYISSDQSLAIVELQGRSHVSEEGGVVTVRWVVDYPVGRRVDEEWKNREDWEKLFRPGPLPNEYATGTVCVTFQPGPDGRALGRVELDVPSATMENIGHRVDRGPGTDIRATGFGEIIYRKCGLGGHIESDEIEMTVDRDRRVKFSLRIE